MALHTEEQKAQAEIDKAIGLGRLPTLRDRECLPYTNALITEVQRRYNFAMLGIPHASREDDVHEGYVIPKGSVVIANVWQFLKDPKVYPDPDRFSLERYLALDGHEPQKEPREYIFGFGRRACPGIHLADASLWLASTSVLEVYDIRPPTKNGQPVLPAVRFTSESISHPEYFECVVKPCSVAAEALIRSSV